MPTPRIPATANFELSFERATPQKKSAGPPKSNTLKPLGAKVVSGAPSGVRTATMPSTFDEVRRPPPTSTTRRVWQHEQLARVVAEATDIEAHEAVGAQVRVDDAGGTTGGAKRKSVVSDSNWRP